MALALGFLAAPLPSDAQQPGKVYRIGQLWGSAPPAPANRTAQQCPIRGWPSWQAFLEGLREYGYLLGQNLVIECRYAAGQAERAPDLAKELVGLQPDLIVAGGWSHNILAAKQATRTIPILMVTAVYKGWRMAADLREAYGVHTTIEKPFDIHKLVAALEGALAGRPPIDRPTSEVLSTEAHRLYRESEALYKAGKKFGVI